MTVEEITGTLESNYVQQTQIEQHIVLAFMIRDKDKWMRRQKVWEEYFEGESLILYRAMDICHHPISLREVEHRLQSVAGTQEAFRETIDYFRYLQKHIENLDGQSFEGALSILDGEHQRANLLSVCTDIILNGDTPDPRGLNESVRKRLLNLYGNDIESSDLLDETQMRIRQERIAEMQDLPKFRSGIRTLDKDTEGFTYGDFVVLVAPTNSGKSFFLAQLAYQGLVQGANIAYFQGEMNLMQSDMRMDTRMAGVKFSDMRSANMSDQDIQNWFSKAASFREKGGSCRTFYMPRQKFTMESVEACLNTLKAEGIVVDMVLIDYILLMTLPNAGRMSQQERITAIAADMNDLSNDFDREDGKRGVVLATVSQAKPSAGSRRKDNDDSVSTMSAEEMTAYAQGINHSANYLFGMISQDEQDAATGRQVMVTLKSRNTSKFQKYVINTRFDRSMFHDSTSERIPRSKNGR